MGALAVSSGRAFRLFFLAFLSMGAVTAVIGATLPAVVQNFQWSYWVVGILLAGNAGGYFVSTLVSGLVVDRLGLQRMLFGGLLFQGLGVLFFGWSAQWVVGFLVLVGVGFGQGMLEVAANCGVIQLDRQGRGRLMNLMHSAFTFGAVLSPLVTGFILGWGFHWRIPFGICGALSLAIAPAVIRIALLPSAPSLPKRDRRIPPFDGRLIGFSICILIYVGVEMGVSSWVGEYFVSLRGSPLATASYLVTLFWLGILAGRLLMSWGYKGQDHWRVLNVFSAISAAGFALLFVAPASPLFQIAVFVTGFGLSILYPEVMVVVGQRYPHNQGWAVGLVASSGGLGALLFPLVIGQLADRWSLRAGFGVFFGMACLMALTFLLLGLAASGTGQSDELERD